jgi:MoxR-like ATPase
VYIYSEEIVLAINVTLAAKRPLLLRGPSGSGKSSMARNIALRKGWRYYEDVISSATQARDLLWRFDALRRFADAQVRKLQPNEAYIEPGVLWWAFDPDTARCRGVGKHTSKQSEAADPAWGGGAEERAVVLLDEIDKADPDVPNSLLVPLGSHEFFVTETGTIVRAHPSRIPLVIITSNDERQLPDAFLRRCVPLNLAPASEEQLIAIAKEHFGAAKEPLYRKVATRVVQLQTPESTSATWAATPKLSSSRKRCTTARCGTSPWPSAARGTAFRGRTASISSSRPK